MTVLFSPIFYVSKNTKFRVSHLRSATRVLYLWITKTMTRVLLSRSRVSFAMYRNSNRTEQNSV